jgi:hypothetical protein
VTKYLVSVLTLVLAASCTKPEDRSATPPPPSAEAPGEAQAALDRLDTRIQVPLLPMMANHQKQNMREHLVAVQEIAIGLASDDFPAVERAAGRIGYSEQMGQMCTHMGAGAPGFTDAALEFHHTADTIAEAARRRDHDGVTRALGSTLQKCTGCHAAFKQHVVDEATFTRLTAASPPSHGK